MGGAAVALFHGQGGSASPAAPTQHLPDHNYQVYLSGRVGFLVADKALPNIRCEMALKVGKVGKVLNRLERPPLKRCQHQAAALPGLCLSWALKSSNVKMHRPCNHLQIQDYKASEGRDSLQTNKANTKL